MNHEQRKQDADRLTRSTGRKVNYREVQCLCNGDNRRCGDCGGEGFFYEAYYEFCSHSLKDDDLEQECYDDLCAEREQVQREPLPLEHKKLQSLQHAEIERTESEAA